MELTVVAELLPLTHSVRIGPASKKGILGKFYARLPQGCSRDSWQGGDTSPSHVVCSSALRSLALSLAPSHPSIHPHTLTPFLPPKDTFCPYSGAGEGCVSELPKWTGII